MSLLLQIKNRKILLPILAFAAIGAGLLVVARAADDSIGFEAESSNMFSGGAIVQSDGSASGGQFITLGSSTPVCEGLQATLTDEKTVSITIDSSVDATAVINYNNPLNPSLRSVAVTAGSNTIPGEVYPQTLSSRNYPIGVDLQNGNNVGSCQTQTVAIHRPSSLAGIELIDPEPYRESIRQATSIQGVTNALNQFLARFAQRGIEIGSPPTNAQTVATTNPNDVWSVAYSPQALTDSADDIVQYKIGANAFMDSASHFPVKLFNHISLDQVLFAKRFNGALGYYAPLGIRGTPILDHYVAVAVDGVAADSYGPSGNGLTVAYNRVKGILAHETGHAFDTRDDLLGQDTSTIFYNNYTTFNPGGTSFVYGGDWQARSTTLPQVFHGGFSYPRSFQRPYSISVFIEDFATVFGSIIADDLGELGYGLDPTRSAFPDVLARAQTVDPDLLGKINLTVDQIRIYEPNFSVQAALDLNTIYGCLGCSL